MDMPHKPNKKCFTYLNLASGQAVYTHIDGSLWSADKVGATEVGKWLSNPNNEINPPVDPLDTYAGWVNRPPEYILKQMQKQQNQNN